MPVGAWKSRVLKISVRWIGRVALACLALSGCGSSGGGDEVIVGGGQPGGGTDPNNGGNPGAAVCHTYVVDKDAPGASDNNDGRYVADGGSGPWRTIQHAVDHVSACDTIQVRGSTTPYAESTGGYAVVISQSGEANKPITVEGFPGERPVLDMQQDGTSQTPIAGILLNCASWLTLRNFEIRNVAEAGVTSALTGCSSNDLTIEELIIHDVYGGNAVAAIRLAGVSSVQVRSNTLYNVFKVREESSSLVFPRYTDSKAVEIEGNSIHTVDAGLIFSMQSAQKVVDATLHHNLVFDVGDGVIFQSDATGGGFTEVDIYGNVFHSLERVVWTDVSSSTASSEGLSIRNNTLADVAGAAIEVDKVSGISSYNNIYANIGKEYIVGGEAASFDYIDNNLYWPLNGIGWTFQATGVPRSYTAFNEWKTAYSSEAENALHADPDLASLAVDPLFTDAEQHNYTLNPNSPALSGGQSALPIGAYFDRQAVGD